LIKSLPSSEERNSVHTVATATSTADEDANNCKFDLIAITKTPHASTQTYSTPLFSTFSNSSVFWAGENNPTILYTIGRGGIFEWSIVTSLETPQKKTVLQAIDKTLNSNLPVSSATLVNIETIEETDSDETKPSAAEEEAVLEEIVIEKTAEEVTIPDETGE
jgi:hypothetical protein